MNGLRLMFVTGSLVHGGAERHSITLMNRLAERGHECHGVYVKNDPSQHNRIRLRDGGTLRCLHAARFFDKAAIKDFAAHIARIAPTVIVAANGYAMMYSLLARRLAGSKAPLVVTFHTTQVQGAKENLKMRIDQLLFRVVERLVFVCDTQRKYWHRRGLHGQSDMVIHNGVDIDHFRSDRRWQDHLALRRQLGIAADDFVIGLSAVMRPEKNHVQLVDAIAALHGMGIPARALMIGDGPTRGAVESRARELGVERDVLITGLQQDIRPYLALCDAVVLCSVAVETFSLAALEAMAMAKPVVLSDVGGAAELIDPGRTGLLFPPGETQWLVRQLSVLADRSLAKLIGENAREEVKRRFSESTMVDRYERMFQELGGVVPETVEMPIMFPHDDRPRNFRAMAQARSK